MAFSIITPDLETTTNIKILPKVANTIFKKNALFKRIVSRAKAAKFEGREMYFPFNYAANDTMITFNGSDPLPVTSPVTETNMRLEPRFAAMGIAIPYTELSVNQSTGAKVIDLMEKKMQVAAISFADALGTMFYTSDGTGNGGKNLLGLAGIIDDGTVLATYGAQSRTTYTSLKAYLAPAPAGALSLDLMATTVNNTTYGDERPTVIVCDTTVFSLYEKIANGKLNIYQNIPSSGSQSVNLGFNSLEFRKIPVMIDQKAPAQTMYFINEEYLHFYALPLYGTKAFPIGTNLLEGADSSMQPTGLGFSWSGWKEPLNQAMAVGQVHFGGNFFSPNPNRLGKVTGATTIA